MLNRCILMAVCRVPEMEFATDRTLRPNDVRYPTEKLAPWAGVEPATFRLTVERSTAELPGNTAIVDSGGAITKAAAVAKRPLTLPPAFRESHGGQPSQEWDGLPAEAPKARRLEATPGIEPGYADLQSRADI